MLNEAKLSLPQASGFLPVGTGALPPTSWARGGALLRLRALLPSAWVSGPWLGPSAAPLARWAG